MKQIDARGLSCPEPVTMLSKAMADHGDSYQLLVDNHAAKENTTRYGEHMGYKVTVAEAAGEYTLTFTK